MRINQWQKGIFIGIALIVIFWFVSLSIGLTDKVQIAITQANDVKRQYKSLEIRKATLEANLATLSTKQGKDAAIRTAFGVARPGEEVIVVVPPNKIIKPKHISWWRKILNWF